LKALLDTTYLLPLIGVSVRGIAANVIRDLRQRRYSISVSSISIFELAAKGAKLVASGTLSSDRVERGLRAALHDSTIELIDFKQQAVLDRALIMREQLSDFIDCLILSSAAATADILLTEDGDISELTSRDGIRAKLNPLNPKFRTFSVRQLPRLGQH